MLCFKYPLFCLFYHIMFVESTTFIHEERKKVDVCSLCFNGELAYLSSLFSCFPWWIEELWVRLDWGILWWWNSNYKSRRLHMAKLSSSFWRKLSTVVEKKLFCFLPLFGIFYAPLTRMLLVLTLISTFSLCWRFRVITRMLR